LKTRTTGAATLAALLLSATALLASDIAITGGRLIGPETRLGAIRNLAIDGDKTVAISEFPLDGGVLVNAAVNVIALRNASLDIELKRMVRGGC
jgi:hypothetical protein